MPDKRYKPSCIFHHLKICEECSYLHLSVESDGSSLFWKRDVKLAHTFVKKDCLVIVYELSVFDGQNDSACSTIQDDIQCIEVDRVFLAL